MDIIKDANGKISSKRIGGATILLVGLILHIVLYFMSMFGKVNDPNTCISVANTLCYVGGGLIGFSVFEGIGKKNDTKD